MLAGVAPHRCLVHKPWTLIDMCRLQLTILIAIALEGAAAAAPPVYRIVALPDTQVYSSSDALAEQFVAQTQWTVANRDAFNIVFLTHLGDIVDNGSSASQWDRALSAMNLLHGQLPYGACAGNHDYDVVGSKASFVNFLQRFGPTRYAGFDWYVGADPTGMNHAQRINAGPGREYLHLTLEWQPTSAVVAWAQSVLDAHPGLPAIISTHEYLQDADSSGVGAGRSGAGLFVWNSLVRGNPQILMVLNGHFHRGPNGADGEYHQVSQNDAGSDDIEMLSDYQAWPSGGQGWMRIIAFDERNSLIRVRTWSPVLGRYQVDQDSQMTFAVDFARRLDPNSGAAPRLRTLRFRNGENGYAGARDTELRSAQPATPFGNSSSMSIDQSDGSPAGPNHGLIAFDDIFGVSENQIGPQSDVVLATLRMRIFDVGSGINVHRALTNWDETATWASLVGGVTADGIEAITAPTTFAGQNDSNGNVGNFWIDFDVTSDVRAWLNGAPNNGWALLPFALLGTNGVDLWTSDAPSVSDRPQLVVVTPSKPVMLASFQQGVAGYNGAEDTELRQANPTESFAGNPTATVDSDEPNGSGNDTQVLVRFNNLLGGQPGRIPAGVNVTSAMLKLTVLDEGSGFTIHHMNADWSDGATWDGFGGGVGADDFEADIFVLATAGANNGKANVREGDLILDVTESVQRWVAGEPNRGWILRPFASGSNGVVFATSENETPGARPKLVVRFVPSGCPGDLNCDGSVDFDDIDVFVEALGYAGGVGWPYPSCPWTNGDCNGDNDVTFDDIDAFVALIGSSCP